MHQRAKQRTGRRWRPLLGSWLGSLCLLAVFSIVVLAAAARPGDARMGEELGVLLPDPSRVHPDIVRSVDVDLSAVGTVAESLSRARSDVIEALTREQIASAHAGSLAVEGELAGSKLLEVRSAEGMARARAAGAEADLGAFAVAEFVEGGRTHLAGLRMNGSVDPRPMLMGDVGRHLRRLHDVAAADLAARTGEVVQLEAELARITVEQAEAVSARATAVLDAAEARSRVDRYGPAFEQALMTSRVRGLDFPVVVLDAYYRAELTMAVDRPSCQVRWYQLAAIGRVESGHGSFGGSNVGADGVTDRRILGPVLDGTQFAAIPDTDGGRHDGDTVWDRAVGPMQFIPGSWKLFGRDGDGDGLADPHNMYDAALSAAEHLCRSHSGLADPGRYRQALFGYNRSVAYGEQVMGYANGYRTVIRLDPDADSYRMAFGSDG